jgi:hypothetical protein
MLLYVLDARKRVLPPICATRLCNVDYDGKSESVSATDLNLKCVSGTVVLQLLAEKFGQGFHRLDVGAKDFERGKYRDREDDTRDSPHPAPENQRKKNKNWV